MSGSLKEAMGEISMDDIKVEPDGRVTLHPGAEAATFSR